MSALKNVQFDDPINRVQFDDEPTPETPPVVNEPLDLSMPENKMDQYFADLEGMLNSRRMKTSDAIERRARGETGVMEGALQMTGQGVALPLLDLSGYHIIEAAKAVMPDSLEEDINEMMQDALGSSWAQKIAGWWNSLSDSKKSTYESATGMMTTILPMIKAKGVNRRLLSVANQKRLEGVQKMFHPEWTKDELVNLAKREGLYDGRTNEMFEVLTQNPMIKPQKSNAYNMRMINRSLNDLESQLMNGLATRPVAVDTGAVKMRIAQQMEEYRLNQKDWLQPDSAIEKAFDLNLEKMFDLIDKHPSTPQGLLMARREFDRMMRDANVDIGTETARKAAAKIVRDNVNDVIAASVPDAKVKDILNRYTHHITAQENLAVNSLKKSNLPQKVINELQRHPYLVAGALGLGGGSQTGLITPEKAAAFATILGVGYGLSKVPVRRMAGGVAKVGEKTPQNKAFVGQSLFYGTPQDERNGPR